MEVDRASHSYLLGVAEAKIERLRELLLKVARDEDRVAASTTMTRPAMREAAAETSAEIRRALEQSTQRSVTPEEDVKLREALRLSGEHAYNIKGQSSGEPYCPFCKKHHPGGDTCMGHHP